MSEEGGCGAMFQHKNQQRTTNRSTKTSSEGEAVLFSSFGAFSGFTRTGISSRLSVLCYPLLSSLVLFYLDLSSRLFASLLLPFKQILRSRQLALKLRGGYYWPY